MLPVQKLLVRLPRFVLYVTKNWWLQRDIAYPKELLVPTQDIALIAALKTAKHSVIPK